MSLRSDATPAAPAAAVRYNRVQHAICNRQFHPLRLHQIADLQLVLRPHCNHRALPRGGVVHDHLGGCAGAGAHGGQSLPTP